MPSKKVSMKASLVNRTSVHGIMGGLYNRKISGRSSNNRTTSRLIIPRGAAAGLAYMQTHNLLSRNPLGSGGVGRMFRLQAGGCCLGNHLGSVKTATDSLGDSLGEDNGYCDTDKSENASLCYFKCQGDVDCSMAATLKCNKNSTVVERCDNIYNNELDPGVMCAQGYNALGPADWSRFGVCKAGYCDDPQLAQGPNDSFCPQPSQCYCGKDFKDTSTRCDYREEMTPCKSCGRGNECGKGMSCFNMKKTCSGPPPPLLCGLSGSSVCTVDVSGDGCYIPSNTSIQLEANTICCKNTPATWDPKNGCIDRGVPIPAVPDAAPANPSPNLCHTAGVDWMAVACYVGTPDQLTMCPLFGTHTVKSGDTCYSIANALCGADYAPTDSTMICNADSVCTNLQVGATIKYDCSKTANYC